MAKTAEELKAEVREYFDLHLPGWKAATVAGRVGELGEENLIERLLILPSSDQPQVPPPQEKASPPGA